MSAAAATAPVQPVLTPRRWVVWVLTVGGGCVALAFAGHTLAFAPPSSGRPVVGCLALFVAACLSERWRLPLAVGEMHLTAVPLICAAVLYGAAAATAIAAAGYVVEGVSKRLDPRKTAFNTGMFALTAGAAGLVADSRLGGLMGAVALAAAVFLVVNVGLVTAIITQARVRESIVLIRERFPPVIYPLILSLSVVPLFVIAWRSHPAIAAVAIVPLLVLGLHLRSADESRRATAMSLTDPLTGLGNRRALANRLQRELDLADTTGVPVSVCVLDLDGFKKINDTGGHDAGDRALVAVADVLRRDGEAFRYGGDEFVLILPSRQRTEAEAVAEAVRERVRTLTSVEGPLTVSVGVATYPGGDLTRDSLIRAADEALYAGRPRRRQTSTRRTAP